MSTKRIFPLSAVATSLVARDANTITSLVNPALSLVWQLGLGWVTLLLVRTTTSTDQCIPIDAAQRFRWLIPILCVALVVLVVPMQTKAASFSISPISGGEAAGIIVGIAAVGLGIGIGAYLLLRSPSITGCVASVPQGLSLRNDGDQQTYTLGGDVAGIKAGDRIRVSGKKKKKEVSGSREFTVSKLKKDFGPCKVAAATN
jgi:hypothetical protein